MKLIATFLVLVGLAFTQTPYASAIRPAVVAEEISPNRGSAALWQSLKKLHTRASLIMITGHPDDEDGGMLTYESRGQGARVTLLTLNRGEGGANVMSPDYFDALGLVRTMELLTAGCYYGVDQYWTRVIDYGFSKTKAESIKKWTHDRVLYDVVRVVRIVRPLVITSVFVGGPSDGHGNHQTAGAMAQEVFKAAGDPNVFPDQIQAGLQPWTPVKDYARQPFFRRGGNDLPVNVQIPEGTYDPMLGMSYVQLSREGLGFQKSQNGGSSIPKAGQMLSPYHRFGSTIPAGDKEKDFFDGIDVSLLGIASLADGGDTQFLRDGLTKINAVVEEATSKFSAVQPEGSAPALAAGLKQTIVLLDAVAQSKLSEKAKYDIRHELEIKRVQFNNALAEALGLSISATVTPKTEPNPLMVMFMGEPETFQTAIPGQTFNVKVHVSGGSKTPVQLVRAVVESYGQKTPWLVKSLDTKMASAALANAQALDGKFEVSVPQNATFTQPYFARPDIEQSYYDIRDERFLNQPLPPYPLCAWAEFTFDGAPIRLGQYVQTVKRVTGEGTVYEPLPVAPAIGVAISPRAGIVPLNAKSFTVTGVVHSNVKRPASGKLQLALPEGWRSEPASANFDLADDGQDQSVTFQITPSALAEKPYQITAVAEYGGRQYKEGYSVTGYTGLRPYFLYGGATYKLSGVDVKVAPDLKIGYVMGSGDDVPSSLRHLGIHVSFLGPSEIATGNLSAYDVILLGVRTYAARDDLRIYNSRILDYVKNGGVIIVQYNTPEFDHNYGPYPYTMTSNPEEVTDEASQVEILDKGNPIFNWPNKISEKDFSGWVEERGSKWMQSWDSKYQALLETHDEGQAPQKGGLLYAKYGKGIYIYNAYAFYRQLPEGVPGAYRLFANMLSLPKFSGTEK
ncbi:MAG: PIG-L family deacetylase [Acidobacteriaceae bacterium]|nr:PIG-L family deacetylase [Acidobacteriaceae bacterium]